MKKIFKVLLVGLILMCVTACSSAPKGTELTLDNYSEYLEITVTYSSIVKGSGKSWNQGDVYIVEVKSKDSSYKFHDVEITIDDIKATYDWYMSSINKYYYNEEAHFDGDDIVIELPESGHGIGYNYSGSMTTGYRSYFNGTVKSFKVTKITGTVSQ